MNKKALLAGLLAGTMLLSSCALVVKDEAVDNATEIIRVGETVHTKGEIKSAVSSYLAEMKSYYYSYYGYNIDVTSAEAVAEAQENVINALIENDVVSKKIVEMGAGELTEEEKQSVDSDYQMYADLIKSYLFADTELEGEELDKAVEAAVAANFGVTKDSLEASAKQSKLKEIVVKDVTVTEEEIQADFDSKVEAAKTSYTESLAAYGSAANSGSTVYYRPAGYRLVKAIQLKPSSDDTAVATAMNTKASEQANIASAMLASINATENAADLDVDALAAQVTVTVTEEGEGADLTLTAATADSFAADMDTELAQLVRDYRAATDLKAAYEAKAAAATEAAYANIAAKADEVLAQLAGGADWDEVMAANNQDTSAAAERGYAVCESSSDRPADFVAAAMALEKVGDVSDKVRSEGNGYYIIKYVEDVVEGSVDLETVREGIQSSLLTAKQNEKYESEVHKWVEEAGAKIDTKALND